MSEAFETALVRPNTKSFPIASNNSSKNKEPKSKTPMIKKGSAGRFKNVRLRERLQREKLRGSGVVIGSGFGFGSSMSPTSSDSSTPPSGNNTFQTRFESRPVKFKITTNKNKNNTSSSNNSIGSSSGIMPCTKFLSPTTPGRHKSPRTRSIRQGRIQISPPTLVPPPTAPPSTTKASAHRNYDRASESSLEANQTTKNNEKAFDEVSVSQPQAATAATFVKRTVHEVSHQPQSSFDSDDDDNDYDNDVASLLCLVPLVCKVSDEGDAAQNEVSCYWPCLVFSGLHKAMLCHNRLYPTQTKVQTRLRKKFMKAATSLANDEIENRIVVLPLGNGEGCCPPEFCGRPLYDAIDKTCSSSSSSSSSNRYWTTQAKKKGSVIEEGKTVVRLLENFDVVGSYLNESKHLIPTVGVALEQALMEMERLSYLDDSTTSDNEESNGKENPNSRPFVSSLKAAVISEDEEHDTQQQQQQPIRFPMYSQEFEMPRWSRSRRLKAATPTTTTTHVNNNNNTIEQAAIQFPQSSQKSRKRPSPSISPDKKSDDSADCRSETNSTGAKGNTVENVLQRDQTTTTSTTTSTTATSNSLGDNETTAPALIEQNQAQNKKRNTEHLSPFTESTTAEMAVIKNTALVAVAAAAANEAQDSSATKPAKKARTHSTTTIPTTNKKKVGKPKKPTVVDSQGTNSTTTIPTKKKKKGRQKQPTVIDSQCRISVSSWAGVKPLLMQLGHVFYDEEKDKGKLVQTFCRPNGDPRENAESSEGEDYFVSLSSYRAHLCAKGVEYFGTNYSGTKCPLKEDDLELIAYWVRFHIFSYRDTGGRKSETIPDLEMPGKGKYVKVLQRIGYKYTYGGLEEGYVVPGAKIKLYLSEKELWEHLGKHGLSPSCKYEKFVSKEEQMALEIQCIRKYHGNHGDKAFRPIRKSDPVATNDNQTNDSEYQECTPAANNNAPEVSTRGPDERDGQEAMSPRKLDNQANFSEHQECTPAASKDALEACTRGPDVGDGQEAISPRKLMTEEIETNTSSDTTFPTSPGPTRVNDEMNLEESADTDSSSAADSANSNIGDDGAYQESRRKENIDVSVESRSTTEGANAAPKQPVSTNGTTAQATLVLEQQPVSKEEVTIDEVNIPGTKNGEKLSACLVNLRKNEIVAHGQLSNSIARIRSFVDTVIESKGRKGDGTGSNKNPILYICGNPGTGKTMSTTKICQDAIAAKAESKDEWEKVPRVCHISCPSLQNFKYQEGMRKIMERMGMKSNQLKRSANDDKNSAKILILDEVDQLLGSKGMESILKQLSSWAKDEGYLLSIIGISNAVYNTKTNRLMEYGMGGMSNKLVFETYQKKDLVKMSQAKIGFSVVDKKAHEFIAAKVANSSGDARQYLELVEKAIIYCRRKLSLEKLETTYTKPIVTIRDAMFSIRETNRKSKDTIQSLTSIEKMTLCAGVHLARKLGGKTVQMGKLRELTMQAFGMDNDVSLEEFKGVIERLQDNGLLQLNETERQAFTKTQMYNLLRYPVQFDLQLEDVDSALEDTLMKEEFYKRMVERLKTIPV